ncbi:MAG: O-antigen ligase family protein [Anaerolineae bacterium]|nr:O-antigen ligase family protein [Anaerolineae bacterium]
MSAASWSSSRRLFAGQSATLWVGAAILAGLVAAQLPLAIALALIGGLAVGTVLLIEPSLSVILMLAVAPLKTLIATESPLPLPLDVGQIAFAAVVFVWGLWRVTARRNVPLPRSWVLLALAVILAGFAPSLWGAKSAGAWLAEWAKWAAMAALVLIVLDYGRAGRWAWIALGVVWAAVLQAVIGLYQYNGGSGAAHLWIDNFRHFRAFGTFGQPNPFSAFMGLALPLTLGLAWGHAGRAWQRARQGTPRWWAGVRMRQESLLAALYALCAALLLAGLIASWGRGAWLGFGGAGAVMVFFAPRRRWQGAALVGVGVLLAGGLWLADMLPVAVQTRLNSVFSDFVGLQDVRGAPLSDANFATVERLAHWQAAAEMASGHLWTGVGLGNYEVAYANYALLRWPNALGHAHNDYLNILAEAGLVGLAGYLLGWAWIVWGTLRSLRHRDPLLRGLALGLLGTWTHFAIHSVVDKLTVNNLFLHLGVMLGLLAWVSSAPTHHITDREYAEH